MICPLSKDRSLVLTRSCTATLATLYHVLQLLLFVSLLEVMANSEVLQVTAGNNLFANKFYNIIAEEEKGKNVFFSPISAHTVLSMVYQGAAGDTASSFATSLNVGDKKIAATGYQNVMNALNSVEDVMLHIANKIYVMNGYPLKENFRKTVADNFLSEAEQVNFADNVVSAKKINGWVEDKTQSKIKDLIPADCLDSLTRLVLVNAIYFKGNWQHKFDKNNTRKEKFYVSNTKTVDCDMMHLTKKFNYREDMELDAKLLEMKYTNHNVSMVIILPNKRDGIDDLEKKLVNVDLSKLTHGMRTVEVEVSLPKFKIETTMDLKSVLTKMGLGVIFDPENANFSEIADSDEQLYVSKAIQKAFIEVNEEGAEAAAATAFSPTVFDTIDSPQFRADHTFAVFLEAYVNDVVHVLFCGIVKNPPNEKPIRIKSEKGIDAWEQNNEISALLQMRRSLQPFATPLPTYTGSISALHSNNLFANKFYNIIAEEEKGKNVLFSPISAHTVLSMVYQGAAGDTASSFATSLNVDNKKIAATGYQNVMSALNSMKDVMLHIANKIYVMNGYPLKENFRKTVADNFLSEAEQVDFVDNVVTAQKINSWVKDKTQSKIKDVISADYLNSLTRLVLVNAIYFNGNWQHKFDNRFTSKEKFYVSNNKTVDCDMMHLTKEFNYHEDMELDSKLLEMKYTNHNVSMVIILPNKRDGIDDLEKKLVNVDLSKLTHGMRTVYVEVSLPKFKIETTIDLKSVLTKMGLGVIFDPVNANFSDVANSGEQLYITEAIQKAFIEVNEEGVVAVAATRFLAGGCMCDIKFLADHPFVVLIKSVIEDSTTVPLFYGKIVKPEW
ncbi:hypothetical protein FQR65_LT02570 [Abscondita terminalis]|nr:hypothetical protein FQR65_LT02570 [Abscondita terminalis]